METMELFDETYYGAKDEEEFHRVMAELKWKRGIEYGALDIPTTYPCLFRVNGEVNGNGRDYANVYAYSAREVAEFATRLLSLF